MPFVASPALIHRHALCFELRVLIKIFPGIVLSLVGLLSLPGVLLASVVLGVRLKRRYLVEIFMSFITHVLFLCCLKIPQNQVSAAGTSRHTIACTICQKSTSRIYFPLFRFLAPLSSGQKRSCPKTVHCKRPYSRVSPLASVFVSSRIVCRIELDPMLRVGMFDVAACVLSNPLTFLRGIQYLRMFHQMYSLLNTLPVSDGFNRLDPASFYMRIAFVFYHLLLM